MKNLIKKALMVTTIASTAWSLGLILRDRGLKKENDRELLSEAVSALSGGLIHGDRVNVTVNGMDYEMHKIYNPYLMAMLGCTGGIACASGNVLVVSDVFRKMPGNIQSGIIAHEFGHMVNGHQGSKRLLFNRMAGGKESLKLEIEADRTASMIVGKDVMLETLRHLLTLPFINKKELRSRIRALEEV